MSRWTEVNVGMYELRLRKNNVSMGYASLTHPTQVVDI